MQTFRFNVPSGQEVVVDASQKEFVRSRKWYATGPKHKQYISCFLYKDGKQKSVSLHRALMGSPDGMQVDHINGNPLDNRLCNLRIAKRAENMWNMGRNSKNTSGYKGVSWMATNNKWQVKIRVNGERKWLGLFDTAEEGYAVYCEAARKYHGDFVNVGSAIYPLEKEKC